MAALRDAVDLAVLTCISVMKDRSFADEAEWRLIADGDLAGPDQIRYRPGASSVIPYIVLPVFRKGDRVLKNAIVGPGPMSRLAAERLELCLTDAGFEGVARSVSSVPFRGW